MMFDVQSSAHPGPGCLGVSCAGHGGSDGLSITREVVRAGASCLRNDGIIQTIGCGLQSDLRQSDYRTVLKELAGQNQLSLRLQTLSRFELATGNAFFEILKIFYTLYNPTCLSHLNRSSFPGSRTENIKAWISFTRASATARRKLTNIAI